MKLHNIFLLRNKGSLEAKYEEKVFLRTSPIRTVKIIEGAICNLKKIFFSSPYINVAKYEYKNRLESRSENVLHIQQMPLIGNAHRLLNNLLFL